MAEIGAIIGALVGLGTIVGWIVKMGRDVGAYQLKVDQFTKELLEIKNSISAIKSDYESYKILNESRMARLMIKLEDDEEN